MAVSTPRALESTKVTANIARDLKSAKSLNAKENELYQGVILLADGAILSQPSAKRFRMLRAKIERLNLGKQQYNVIAITSALPQEGKSVVATNLARALSIDPLGKTLLLDCDLRRPNVHNFFKLKVNQGLSDYLLGQTPLYKVIQPVTPRLDIITAGTPIPNPTQAIEKPELPQLIDELRNHYRYIIVDCPPAVLCPEPITISSFVDTTLLVARAWRTQKRIVKDAINLIGKSKLLGIVMNDCVESSKQYLDYGYYSYRYGNGAAQEEEKVRSK